MIWVIGVRSFAVEVAEWARDAGLEVAGLLDPSGEQSPSAQAHDLPVRPLGAGRDTSALVGTGENDRRATVARARAAGIELRGLVHPRAHVAASAVVEGTALVGPGVVVGAAAKIGAHVVLGRGSLVGHHTTIGSFATLGPGANVAGNATVGERTHVAMGALVRDHVSVGPGALIAMGAVVVADVPAGVEVRGLPAQPSRP